MSRCDKAPGGHAFQGHAAGREQVSAKSGFPRRRHYHRQGRGGGAELVRVWTPQGERVVGAFVWRDGEQALEKLVDERVHLLRYPREAWGVDRRALEMASRRGVQRVVIHDRRRGTWWARLADFEAHGVPVNRSWGEQVALDLGWFSFVPKSSETARQLGLVAEVGR